MSPKFISEVPPSQSTRRPMRGEVMRKRPDLASGVVSEKPNEEKAKIDRINDLYFGWEKPRSRMSDNNSKIVKLVEEIDELNKKRQLGQFGAKTDALVSQKWSTEERELREQMELVIADSIPDIEEYATAAQEFDQLNKEIGRTRREKRMVIYFFEDFYKPAKEYGLVKALKALDEIKSRFDLIQDHGW